MNYGIEQYIVYGGMILTIFILTIALSFITILWNKKKFGVEREDGL